MVASRGGVEGISSFAVVATCWELLLCMESHACVPDSHLHIMVDHAHT
jgi:hypothetical protein